MSIRNAFIAFVASAPIVQAGCDTGLQGRLDEARDNRYAAAKGKLAEVETKRYEALLDALPDREAKPTGDDHPLMAWRKSVIQRDESLRLKEFATRAKSPVVTTRILTTNEAEKLGTAFRRGWHDCKVESQEIESGKRHVETCTPFEKVMGMGTPAQEAADAGALFLKTVSDYWNSATNLPRYLTAISAYEESGRVAAEKAAKQKAEDPSWDVVALPFLDEANFDRWFVHAASFLQLAALPDREVAWTAMHPDYGVVFGTERRGGEGGSDYISRLCFQVPELREVCKAVPHEFRAALVDRTFLMKLIEKVRAYKAITLAGDAVFGEVARRILGPLEKATSTELSFKEELVLPSISAPVDGRSGVRVVVSEGAGIVATTDADVKLAPTFTGSIPATLLGEMTKLLTATKDKPGNRVDYQRVVLEMAGKVSQRTFVDAIRSIPKKLGEASGVKDVFLVGRRRLDESMRLAALKLSIREDSETMSYKFANDAAKTTCDYIGNTGASKSGKKNQFYLEVLPNRVRVARVTFDEKGEIAEVVEEKALGTGADLTEAKKWLDENPGIVRLFMKVDGDYDKVLSTLSDLVYKCTDEEVVPAEGKTAALVRTCGQSEMRPAHFAFALCN
jgi:hypothetical protein